MSPPTITNGVGSSVESVYMTVEETIYVLGTAFGNVLCLEEKYLQMCHSHLALKFNWKESEKLALTVSVIIFTRMIVPFDLNLYTLLSSID